MNHDLTPVILGDGIAGLSAAIRLAARGARPVVVGKDVGQRATGWIEVVHGAAARVLDDLQLGDVLASAPRCTGVWSRWSMDGFILRPSILDPFGAASIVDKSDLVDALRQRATAAGVQIVDACRWTGNRTAAGIIATGRSAATGIARRREVAMAVRCRELRLGATDTLIVDAQPDGWWCALESLGSAMVCFTTDAETVRRRGGLRRCWERAVDGCDWLPGELGDETPMVRDATSGFGSGAGEETGPLCVGDAAWAFDALSGQGLHFAMASAKAAADAIADGQPGRYTRWVETTIAAQSSLGGDVLSTVRFADRPYWARRMPPCSLPRPTAHDALRSQLPRLSQY